MKKVIFIFAVAVILRLINLNQSFWLDEAISALAARDSSYIGTIFNFLKIDNHPPLFYLLLKFWGQIFGFIDINLRLLPVLLGSLLALIIYKIGYITGGKRVGFVAALLTAASPLLVYYSQEVRMYILITLLVALQIWQLLNLEKKGTLGKLLIFSLLNCLLFFSDYVTVFFFPVLVAFPLIKKDFKLLKKVLLSFLPLLILFIFWFPVFSAQINKNNELINSLPGWKSLIGGATLKNLVIVWLKFILGRISFEPKFLYYGLVGIFSIPVLMSLFCAAKQFRKQTLIWLWFIVPLISGFLFSFIIPVFNYFRFTYVLPAMLILVVIGIGKLKRNFQIVLVGAILISNLIGLLIYYFDPAQHRENWRQAVSFIEQNAMVNDLVVFEFREDFAPYRWYAKGKVDSLGVIDLPLNSESVNKKLEINLATKNRVYYFEYLRDLADPQKLVEKKLEIEGFKKQEAYNNFKNIGQISLWTR